MPQDLVSQKDDSGSCDLPLCKSPTLIMADARPFWSALYHSLTLM
jgi:hypothetical protein